MFRYNEVTVKKIEAQLLAQEVAVIWSLSEEYQHFLAQQQLPSHWKIEKFVPQAALLQSGKVDVFCTHCGSNSVYEALLSGVPMVSNPGSADQPANAVRIARAGVGIIAKDKEGGLGAALASLLENLEEVTLKSRSFSKTLSSSNAGQKAVDLI